jgi:hypothetical protein
MECLFPLINVFRLLRTDVLRYKVAMKLFNSATILSLALFLGAAAAHAETITDQQARVYAERGVAQFNSTLPTDGSAYMERVFEGYGAISAQTCDVTATQIKCAFDVTEDWGTDADVYTPNTLTVTVDRATDQLSVEIEWGC